MTRKPAVVGEHGPELVTFGSAARVHPHTHPEPSTVTGGYDMLHDYLISLLRTAVPAGVGAALAWLSTEYGIVLDDDVQAQAVAFTSALATAVYYAAARALELRWPAVGRLLLGSSKQPLYGRLP